MPVLVAAAKGDGEVSVAVKVQGLVPPSMLTKVKLNEPPESVPTVVPAMVHDEVIETVSV
jgi:hypothetical protein